MDLGLKNKRALVLGSSSGIGRGIAEVLVQEGARVALCARNPETLEEVRKKIGAELALAGDLSKAGSAKEVLSSVIQKWGGIDILVVNTGGPAKGGFEEITDSQWNEGIQSLWTSAIDSIRAALPAMKSQKWGRILIVTSLSAKEPLKAMTISNGLRAGLSGLTKSIANEIAPYGITVNSLLPGYTDTDRLRELNLSEETVKGLIPAGRLGTTREFGSLAAFLASDLAGYITGQSILIDGGATRSF